MTRFMAATAQANAEAIKEAQRGGIALAKATDAATKYRGRKPSFTRAQFFTVHARPNDRDRTDRSRYRPKPPNHLSNKG
jgi:DNA invertase Pin-like site-specific DNA recombinase